MKSKLLGNNDRVLGLAQVFSQQKLAKRMAAPSLVRASDDTHDSSYPDAPVKPYFQLNCIICTRKKKLSLTVTMRKNILGFED